ncbi:CAP domain-containing protein [Litorisediminicola beolgyonensis]|uniref:CAP domain-containing protein n=1 Tax=Litorisediminicola beolgyonensis TaxID=1173614 RepID=A0ABW3ZLK1_9RHOB
MTRILTLLAPALIALAACAPQSSLAPAPLGPDGKPLPRAYRISAAEAGRIEFRMLDAMNTLREARGTAPLALNSQLRAAAATHARDMSVQNRPWHFGSDGSSPLERVRRTGYSGILIGEAISETYETELETLAAWMEDPATRDVVLDPDARDMGFAWFQEPNGKIWWTLVTGGPDIGGGAGPV